VEAGERILVDPRSEQRGTERLEVLDALYDALRREDRFERGLEIVRLRNAAGWLGRPDGRCDEAEMLLRVGQRTEAIALFEQCWEGDKEPWWVANNAGLAFTDASEHEQAVAWLGRGIEVAMAVDDPDHLVAQMCDLRRTSSMLLGRSPDALQREAEAFADRARRRQFANEDRARVITDALVGLETPLVATAMAWFPESEYERALALWPDALERFAGVAYQCYCGAIEVDMRALSSAGVRVSHVARVTVAGLTAHAAALGIDPASASARAGLAAELARLGEATPWPPGRNDRCWCDQPAKYKRCCGAVVADQADLRDTAAAAGMLRRLTTDPQGDVAASRRASSPAGLLAELDQFAEEFRPVPDVPSPELEDEFGDLVSDVFYPWFLELVRGSPDGPLDVVLDQAADVLGHDIVRGSLRRDAAVRLSLAEAFAAEGRPAAASELAESVLAALEDAGEAPDTIELAVAITYLVDVADVEGALQRYRALVADRPGDAGMIGEIAGDALCDRGYALEGLPWLVMALDAALRVKPAARRDVQAALARLRRAWAVAGVEPDQTLIQQAADALGVMTQPPGSRQGAMGGADPS